MKDVGQAFYWSMGYRKPTLVKESDFLIKVLDMPIKSTIKTKLITISYFDMVEKQLNF